MDRALRPLAGSLARLLGEPDLAEATLRLVRERAPDERLALAFLAKLAEASPDSMAVILRDPARASDLVFCLGASELAGTGLATVSGDWAGFFERARVLTAEALLASIRFEHVGTGDAASSVRDLVAFKRRIFLEIVIADLLGRLTVSGTVAAMTRLADQCIGGALDIAKAALGETARLAGDFCVVALGKLGASELNLSSDIDLMYIFGGPDDAEHQDAARRLGERLTEILSADCFRVDMRLRPGGRNSPLVISLETALGFYETLGQTWERAALLRARPVAGALGLGNRMIMELGRFIYRSYLDFD
ncbi:MAG TPA: DUF294 nucleotidyltransferase-like domain-containing protein, partial [Candidatus Binataceae bacterium]|nr:DUF294 nucleotidyltransferase-like domain-containing protein [Candidatus Binataceae bacterium]